eukprot:1549229-Prymnesium_polylepis.1
MSCPIPTGRGAQCTGSRRRMPPRREHVPRAQKCVAAAAGRARASDAVSARGSRDAPAARAG